MAKISEEDARVLERPFSESEVWEAVKCCDSEKAPVPDGFNFRFIKRFWGIIKECVMQAVLWF